ncbi:Stk1 family PASTA domain-containing Ser/Thr kinase [Demequina pelophila]|uniref:Stk1 family PASTA domain-containing Ser/Thr kinase n=1 Tax=Demequina pelophila TaxID=1638984 RepID=UPI0009E651D5|nr:Stk1 family PASTA domain-containing Ser/Thr kinase [Demequina pelophila]
MNDEPKILGGRYEVGDLIGRGGMAEVHVGYDTRLGRTVAIKILRADLARDPSFQTRFRREAQAAAGLNHPSIVAVYDTGEDVTPGPNGNPQAVPYIVMEYVEGHTVRDILKGDVAAPIDEAVEITAGVLAALDYSHHAGLVHRDIKPANIMLTPTGAVKVMDFGIARALADAGQTMTQTQAVVGTAQYLSPEQARGETVDARSDLYSTGCVLFELLTGRPPFVGDSPVSVAYQHVREAAPRPSQYASDVPDALDRVVLRALSKNRDERYSSAQEFLADLRAVMAGDQPAPTTGQFPLGSAAFGAGAVGVAAAGAAAAGQSPTTGQTEIVPGQPATGETAVMPGASPWGAVNQPASVPPAAGAAGAAGGMATGPGTAAVSTVDDAAARRRKTVQWSILAAALVAVALLILALFMMTRSAPEVEASPSPTAAAVQMPDLENATEADARSQLEALGLSVTIQREGSEDVDQDLVTRTDPPAGQMATEGDTVTLYLSSGPDVVTIPDVRGFERERAEQTLEDAGITVNRFDTEDDPGLSEGRITRTEPAAGEEVASGSAVTLYASSGKVELPDLSGKSESEARGIIQELGLSPSSTTREVDAGPYDVVVEQSPVAGRVDQGSSVEIVIAIEPSTVSVPDVVGRSQTAAVQEIEGAGLFLGSVTVDTSEANPDAAGTVKSMNPRAGTEVTPDTTVDLVVWCDVRSVLVTAEPEIDPDNPDATPAPGEVTETFVCR